MKAQRIEQLLHGYRRGHEQLAGSVKLQARDAELVTRLSDLSGTLSGVEEFDSYLTVYPLPSGKYFASAKTWLDPEAVRAGCVLTHTLLIPTSLWSTLREPQLLEQFYAPVPSRSSRDFNSPIAFNEALNLIDSKGFGVNQGALLQFVQFYFGEGRRPIVWFGEIKADELLWKILRSLWPRLRRNFAACTYCLQPRTLEERSFDLMFAPSPAYSRFLKINAENFIDSNAVQRPINNEKADGWAQTWITRMFSPRSVIQPPYEVELWNELDEDPTVARRLFLLDSLIQSNDQAPQVFVGAMDLVESLAKDRDTGIASKKRVAEIAVRAARDTPDPASGLESLRLIEDRLRRSSFAGVKESIGPSIVEAVSNHTRNSPEACVQSAVALDVNDAAESWVGQGLVRGFRELADRDPQKLLVLRDTPMASHILMIDPDVRAAFIKAAFSQRRDVNSRARLLRWLSDTRDYQSRKQLRALLVPNLDSADSDILGELLKDVPAEEAAVLLGALFRKIDSSSGDILDLAVEFIARRHPSETRRWLAGLDRWPIGVAKIYAATYPVTRQGLSELLDQDSRLNVVQRAESLAAFMEFCGSDRLPYWLRDAAAEDASLLIRLLDAGSSPSEFVEAQAARLLADSPQWPTRQLTLVLAHVLSCSQKSYFAALMDVAMLNALPAYVAGDLTETDGRSFFESADAASWFRGVDARHLKSLLTKDVWSSRRHWFNAWQWTSVAPPAIFSRDSSILVEVVGALLRSHHLDWSPEIAGMWINILRRSRSTSNSTPLSLYAQALKFAFDNTRLPLGPVVVETFYEVYSAVTESRRLPPEASALFGAFDWDKGKELRRELVDSFLHSQWAPGDLPLAVADVDLLRKIFKRLMRKSGGERYARAALADLESRVDKNANVLARALSGMIAMPEFYEEWD